MILIDDHEKDVTLLVGETCLRYGKLVVAGDEMQFVTKPEQLDVTPPECTVAAVLVPILWRLGYLAAPTALFAEYQERQIRDQSARCILCDLPLELHLTSELTSIHRLDDTLRFSYRPQEVQATAELQGAYLHCPACGLWWEAEMKWGQDSHARIEMINVYTPFEKLEEDGITRNRWLTFQPRPDEDWLAHSMLCRICDGRGKDFLGDACSCCHGAQHITVGVYRAYQQKLHGKEVSGAKGDRLPEER